jgi:hypothetical protein
MVIEVSLFHRIDVYLFDVGSDIYFYTLIYQLNKILKIPESVLSVMVNLPASSK